MLKYFAYGSNMHPERLRRRTPSCRVLGVARLPRYELRFHKRSPTDGSGKCNLAYTGRPEDAALGVVYEIEPSEKVFLDQAEGPGYEVVELAVNGEDANWDVFCYLAKDAYIDEQAVPFAWYRDLVLQGARYHGLPADYLADLERVVSAEDPDRARHRAHEEILNALPGRPR